MIKPSDIPAYESTPPWFRLAIDDNRRRRVDEIRAEADDLEQRTWITTDHIEIERKHPHAEQLFQLAEALRPGLVGVTHLSIEPYPSKSDGVWRFTAIHSFGGLEFYVWPGEIGEAMEKLGMLASPCPWCAAAADACDCVQRTTCIHAGELGHWSCGWCTEHKQPIHSCPLACSVRQRKRGHDDP